jgi:hypothetical protein
MHNSAGAFNRFKAKKGKVYLGDNSPIPSTGSGTTSDVGKALLVPDLDRPLISTGQDDADGLWTLFGNGKVTVVDKEPRVPKSAKTIRSGRLAENGLYELVRTRESETKARAAHVKSMLAQNPFHELTHFTVRRINHMIATQAAEGLPTEAIEEKGPCGACMQGRMRKPPVKKKTVRHLCPRQ